MKKYLVYSCLASLISCGGENFPNYSLLRDLRVLALVPSSPEVNPGATLQVTPVLSFVEPKAGESLTWSASACLDPGVTEGAGASCDTSTVLATLTPSTQSFTLNGANGFTEAIANFSVQVPATFLDGLSTVQKLVGKDLVIIFKFFDSEGHAIVASKKVRVSLNPEPNTNPPALGVLREDGAVFQGAEVKKQKIRADYASDAAQEYTYYDGQRRKENLIVTWFTTDGKFYTTRTVGNDFNEIEFPEVAPSSGRKSAVAAVLRDDRGGVSVKLIQGFSVLP